MKSKLDFKDLKESEAIHQGTGGPGYLLNLTMLKMIDLVREDYCYRLPPAGILLLPARTQVL